MDFKPFKLAVASQFERMARGPLFRVKLDPDVLWLTYQGAWPEGTNKVFRQRRDHDCSACRRFIRAVGNVVAINADHQLVSIWDITVEEPYRTVAAALAAFVKCLPIANVFRHTERVAGKDKDFEELTGENPGTITWEHLFVNLPRECVMVDERIGPYLSEMQAQHDVLMRSLLELQPDVVDTVIELIAQGSLYRGEEEQRTLQTFQGLQVKFAPLRTDRERDAFVWAQVAAGLGPTVAKIRNHAIGTLLVDLSGEPARPDKAAVQPMELEDAVRKYEVVKAPANYKRPTALVTKAQIERAKQTLKDMGLLSALERRYATKEDLRIPWLLFADRSIRTVLTGDVFDELTAKAADLKSFDRVEEVGVDEFLANVLPRALTLEIMVENRHEQNFVSLVAPTDPTAGKLLKWGNGFSWSYKGDFADSIARARVKAAGGNVTGDWCNRLAWSNFDDLDFHMHEPNYCIYYGNRNVTSPSGGRLDVDANAGGGSPMRGTRTPVENIFYATRGTLCEGEYKLVVHQYAKMETVDVGFEVEVDWMGTITRFAYDKAVRGDERIQVAKFWYSRENGVRIVESLPSSELSRTIWGLATQQWHRVNVMCLSPNYWDGQGVGNRHFMFFINGCVNDGTARGFFNEQLADALTPHRKVLEMVGSKVRAPESGHQLSGLGFSATMRNNVLVRVVSGNLSRVLKIVF